jgi:signal transduction histidine kinase
MELYTKHIITFNQIGIGVLVIGLYAATFIFVTEKFEAELKQVIKQSAKIVLQLKRAYMEKLVYFQEEDRKRLSEELHDNIMSRFQLMRLNLFDGNLELLQKNLLNSMKIVRELSHNFAPLTQNMSPLSILIEEYIIQIQDQLQVRYATTISATEKELSDTVKLMVFRIFQELISNILKHSNATAIDIRLRHTTKSTVLYVKDNGCGFDLEKASKGIGLKNIDYRAKLIKSSYKFKIQKEKQTIFIICIPHSKLKNYENTTEHSHCR